jgi:hypothetical protein
LSWNCAMTAVFVLIAGWIVQFSRGSFVRWRPHDWSGHRRSCLSCRRRD